MTKCQRCGTEDETVSTHSGVEECRKCWDYRKLDRPAAVHWEKAGAEFLSNVDMYDIMYYLPKCGLSKEEMHTMLSGAKKVQQYSALLVKHGPEHRWSDEVREEWQKVIAS